MTTAEFEAAFMDEAATAKIRLTKTTDDTVLLPGSPAKLPHTFFEDPMACAPYSVNLMGARTRRHASAMDAVPHPLPSVMFPTVPGLSGVMPAKEIPLSDIVVWYTCPAVFPMGP